MKTTYKQEPYLKSKYVKIELSHYELIVILTILSNGDRSWITQENVEDVISAIESEVD